MPGAGSLPQWPCFKTASRCCSRRPAQATLAQVPGGIRSPRDYTRLPPNRTFRVGDTSAAGPCREMPSRQKRVPRSRPQSEALSMPPAGPPIFPTILPAPSTTFPWKTPGTHAPPATVKQANALRPPIRHTPIGDAPSPQRWLCFVLLYLRPPGHAESTRYAIGPIPKHPRGWLCSPPNHRSRRPIPPAAPPSDPPTSPVAPARNTPPSPPPPALPALL